MAEPQRKISRRDISNTIRNPRDRQEVDRRRTYTTAQSAALPQDSQPRVTYRSPTAYAQNIATVGSLHETTSDTFNNEQYAGGIPTKPAGISNVQVDYRTRSVPTPASANVNQRPINRNERKINQESEQILQPSAQIANQNRPNARKKGNQVKRVISVAYRTAARASLLSAYAWTGFIWITIQIPLAIIGFIAIGIVFGIEQFIGTGVTQSLYSSFVSLIGVDWDFYLVAFLSYLIVVTACYSQLLGVWFQTTLTGMKPLGGKGLGLKYGTFLLAMLMYWIPGVNLFPWVWLWILAIGINPR